MEDCVFCKIVRGDIPSAQIYEDEDFVAFVDLKPNNYGHSLLVPKVHYKNIYELDGCAKNRLAEVIQRMSAAIKEAMNADGINVHMNNDSAAGQVIFHQHTHIIPRFENDGLEHFVQKEYEYPEQRAEIAEKIRSVL
jgi:histidine triad (HIT) family protein